MSISQDPGTYVELTLCVGCVMVISNGGCDGCLACAFTPDGEPDPCAGLAENFGKAWPMGEWHVATVPDQYGDTEPRFSRRDCDGCGETAYGDRFDAIAMPII